MLRHHLLNNNNNNSNFMDPPLSDKYDFHIGVMKELLVSILLPDISFDTLQYSCVEW